ncbi:glycosyltransferase [Desulfoplanes sp.]
MKISIVGPTYPFRGGIAQHTTILCNTMRLEHDVQFISYTRQYPKLIFPGSTDRDPSADALKSDPVEYLIDSMNPFSWRQATKSIVRFGPQIIVFPWWVIFWAPQLLYIIRNIRKKIKTKIIILCHNVSDHESNKTKENINKLVMNLADVLITQSTDETKKLSRLINKNKKIITAFHPTYKKLCSKNLKLCDKKKKNQLLFFGFVRKYKGLDVLLDALPLVQKKKKIHLNIVGEFWNDKQYYLDKIESLKINESISLVDEYVPNERLAEYFFSADLVIQPYLSASGSGVSQLAYGFGVPVIATKVGSIAEVINDRVNGRLVEPRDPQGLAEAILESLEPDTLGRMKVEAKKVKDQFSWDKFADIIATC